MDWKEVKCCLITKLQNDEVENDVYITLKNLYYTLQLS